MMKETDFNDSMHRAGRRWMLAGMLLLLLLPLTLSVLFQTWPEPGLFLKSFLGVGATFIPIGVIEVLTYSPMLGTGGTYLAFVTGNITTIKVPVVTSALQAAGVKASTPEGDALSTIVIAVSSIVTTLIIALGALLMAQLAPVFENPALAPAFDQVIPALFGALGILWIPKNFKLAWVPLLVTTAAFLVLPDSFVSLAIPFAAIVAMIWGRALYKRGWAAEL